MKLEELGAVKRPDFYLSDMGEDRLAYYLKKDVVAIDTETRGLNIARDRLCLIQICDSDGVVSLVRYQSADACPNVKRLLEAQSVLKLFHFARFDIAVLRYYLQSVIKPIWCTKIASKLARTYSDRHSLKDLSKELLGIEMDKTDQSSDWAREDLSLSQLEYAANDVRVLIPIYMQMKAILEREGRLAMAEKLFAFLPVVAELDLAGWKDIFEH